MPTTTGERIAAVLLSAAQAGMPTSGLTVVSQNSGTATAASVPFTSPKAGQSCAMILLSAQSVGSTTNASTTMTSRNSTLVEGVATYPPGDAARLLAPLPAALAHCAPRTPPGLSQYPQTLKVATSAGPSLGNGSLLIHDTITPTGHPVTYGTILISRYGDRILWLEITRPTRALNDHDNLTALTKKIAADLKNH